MWSSEFLSEGQDFSFLLQTCLHGAQTLWFVLAMIPFLSGREQSCTDRERFVSQNTLHDVMIHCLQRHPQQTALLKKKKKNKTKSQIAASCLDTKTAVFILLW